MTTKRPTTRTSNFVSAFRDWFVDRAGAALLRLTIDIDPVPASRPRVGKFGTYYAKTYAKWRKAALPFAKAFEGPKLEGPVAVMVEQIVQKPKTTKRFWPKGDVDNYVKAPLDVLTKGEKVWKDDDQVVFCTSTKRFTETGEAPGTFLYWFPLAEEEDT
ncbi:RusA family crossover junction endodeoxyribonuclease [Marivibrio halodurans]|uniref:RusA family crossover junction endodeoxyribonuclease n=1 Tax=Marivibrio halodurans TaxID=2039722 RepID=A0A8J7RWI3_9PROT|nr:RusA family crossover junction endodeoxyribonuclease [Marivibrio halodurans]MBP5855700.1 RusA family crossover junction endodeoxyribonuclease [Marivibrio halodurans]